MPDLKLNNKLFNMFTLFATAKTTSDSSDAFGHDPLWRLTQVLIDYQSLRAML